ncbi:hypothetical protein ZWY2020_002418 [Hordeum vulgare]|nr:hypothetical protein ZWY2020_002418 [Hordeum vulgare]
MNMCTPQGQRLAASNMSRSRAILRLLLALCILSCNTSISSSASTADAFLHCLAAAIPPHLLHTPPSPSYSPLLLSSARNLRFVTPGTPRPLAIVAAGEASHAQAAVRCGRLQGVRVRVRSGGHDYEGLSYLSLDPREPFALLDLAALRAVRVDPACAEAWVGSGATLGELYYAVAAASRALAFPAGVCPTVGVGGHLCGGGFGTLMRRDLDLGRNELGSNVTSYAKARVWGEKYFKGNFERLAAVKAMVDPGDFFRNEQSIPPLPAAKGWNSM